MLRAAPYSPDRLIELVIDEGGVTAEVPDYFRRPPRLSAAEGFALLAAGRALLAVPGSDVEGPLAKAMEKLGDALGASRGMAVELDAPEHLDVLRAAAEANETVEVDYYSASRDEATTRQIDPVAVFTEAGHWYAVAYCHRAEAVLTFRVDRMNAVRPTGKVFQPPRGKAPTSGVFRAGPDTPLVTLDIPASARWVVETYPTESVVEDGDRLVVKLAISGRAWLDRLLLRIGPTVKVLDPRDLRTAPRDIARRVLATYTD